MSIHELKARSLVPAVPKREPAVAQGWFATFIAWVSGPPVVPRHLREDVGLPPEEPSIFDFPLVDLGRNKTGKTNDWMN